jgi:hypothetical protein
MRTRLRIVAAYIAFTILLVIIGLWVRSYHLRELVRWDFGIPAIQIQNRFGEILLQLEYEDPPPLGSQFYYKYIRLVDDDFGNAKGFNRTLGFSWYRISFANYNPPSGAVRLTLPHWSIAILVAVTALALRPTPRFRMSIRSILFMTMLTAFVLTDSIKL